MRSLAGSLADGVLADTILISPRPPIPSTNIRRVRGREKVRKLKKKKRRRGVGMAERFSKMYGNKG